MTRRQCRAARAILNWTQYRLAENAALGISTIRDYERGAREPTQESMTSIVEAFTKAGVEFGADNYVRGPIG